MLRFLLTLLIVIVSFGTSFAVSEAERAAIINNYTGDGVEEKNINIDFTDKTSIKTISETVDLKWLIAEELAVYLRPNLSQYGRIQTNERMNSILITDIPNKASNLVEIAKKLDQEKNAMYFRLGTRTYVLDNNKPDELLNLIKTRLSDAGEVTVNNGLNIIMVKDIEAYLEMIDSLIEHIDLVKRQVMISLNVISYGDISDQELGIDWDIGGRLGREAGSSYLRKKGKEEKETSSESISDGTVVSDDYSKTKVIPKTISELTRYAGDITGSMAGIIKVMKKTQNAKEISTPTLVTTNNEEGYFRTNLFQMQIIPTIGSNQNVRLGINYKISNGSESHSELIVKTGHTFMLSGFSYETTKKIKKKVPVLGRVLPFLFSKEQDVAEKSNLMVFITPTILTAESNFNEQLKREKNEYESKDVGEDDGNGR